MASIRGISYSEDAFHLYMDLVDHVHVPIGYFAAWLSRETRLHIVCRSWSSWPVEVGQVWPVWSHWLGKKGEAALSDFVFVVPGSVLIPRLQEEISRFDFNWLYLAMALLKALFGFRRITL